jgi:hypothetical protein
MTEKHAEASETIAGDADAIYDLVCDLTQMGKWSPEATGGRWTGGATGPTVGAKFRGNNRSGWRRWSTVSEITTADRGARFAFHVSAGGVPVSEWSYDFEPDGTGTHVVEKWSDLRPGWMDRLSRPLMGVPDRAVHNQRNMALTLTALKTAVETGQS